MTPGNDFGSVPPRRAAAPQRQRSAEVQYEYKTVSIKSHWSRRRQDKEINGLAAQGWELIQRSPRGGLLGGSSENATFRRPARADRTPEPNSWSRMLAWWSRQSTTQRWMWASLAAVLLVAMIVNEAASA